MANVLFQIFHGDNKRTTELSRQKRGHRPQAADPWEALSYREIQWWERRLSERSGNVRTRCNFRERVALWATPPKNREVRVIWNVGKRRGNFYSYERNIGSQFARLNPGPSLVRLTLIQKPLLNFNRGYEVFRFRKTTGVK